MAKRPDITELAKEIKDPMLSDSFVLTFPKLPAGLGADISKRLMLHCQQATKPGMTINPVEVQLFGHTLEYAGNNTFSHDMSVTFIENRDGNIQAILEKWAIHCRHPTTQIGAYKEGADGYAAKAELEIFDQTGKSVKTYHIFGCWPSSVPEVSFDGSNSSLITLACTFKFDTYGNTDQQVPA